jgi:hypothetical protein
MSFKRTNFQHIFALAVAIGIGLASLSPSVARAELVTNGGFETGDFTGWSRSGNAVYTGVTQNDPHSGTYGAYFGNTVTTGTDSQTLTTVAGAQYDLDFWLANTAGGTSYFSVSFDGTVLKTLANSDPFGYTEFTFSGLTASTDLTTLAFTFQNDAGYYLLDDVSVTPSLTATPLPAALPMFATGLAGLGLLGWRKRRKAVAAV